MPDQLRTTIVCGRREVDMDAMTWQDAVGCFDLGGRSRALVRGCFVGLSRRHVGCDAALGAARAEKEEEAEREHEV